MSLPSYLVTHLDLILPFILFIIGLALRLTIITRTGFDGLYGQDSFAYYDFAKALSEGHPTPDFFWPLGYPGLMALGFKLFGTSAKTGQIINLLLGALLPPLVYSLTRQLSGGKWAALIAGTLMLICGQALQSSLVLMADIPALFWALLSAVCLWVYLSDSTPLIYKRIIWLILCAVSLALACVIRWLYLILIIPWAIAFLWHQRDQIHWRHILIAGGTAALIFIPQILYSMNNTAPTLNHAWVEGWSIDNAFKREFTNIDGHFEYAQENRFFYAKPFYDPYYLAPIFTPFILIGFTMLIRRKHYPAAAMLHLWALLPFCFLIGIPYQNIRFPLIVFPAIAVLASIGFESLGKWIWQKTSVRALNMTGGNACSITPLRLKALLIFRRALLLAAAATILTLGVRETLNVGLPAVETFITNQQRDRAAAEYAVANIPAGSTLYTFGLTLTLKHYTDFTVYELYYETPESLNQRWVHGQEDYLLLNLWNIENQWEGREPQIAYHWLRDRRGLTQLGRNGYYTLFRIGG